MRGCLRRLLRNISTEMLRKRRRRQPRMVAEPPQGEGHTLHTLVHRCR